MNELQNKVSLLHNAVLVFLRPLTDPGSANFEVGRVAEDV